MSFYQFTQDVNPSRVALLCTLALLAPSVLNAQNPGPNSRVSVQLGGERAPIPIFVQPAPRGGQAADDGEESGVSDELKDILTGGAEAGVSLEDGDALLAEGATALEDGESPDAEAKQDLIKKFVSLFQDSDSDAGGAETDEQRRIREGEWSARRNYERRRFSQTKKGLNDLITLKPYDPNYHFALGLVFRKESRHDDAFKKYQDVLDLGGPKPLVHLLMAESMAAKGEKEKVMDLLKQAAVEGRNIIQDVQILSLLSEFSTDTEFIKLALSLEQYELTSKKDQDPFTDRFLRIDQGPDPEQGGRPTGPERLTPAQQQTVLNDARKAFDRVQWFIKLEDESKAMENYIELKRIIALKDKLTLPKIRNDFRLLVSRMEPLEARIESIRLKYYYNEALGRLRLMKEAFQEAEYGRVKAIHEEVKKLARDMELTNERYKPVADRVLSASVVWIRRTEIREEFNQNKPTIQGIIIAPDTKKAIIDNRILAQGEQVKEYVVQKVESNRITFRYKGEEIPLVFRRY